MGAIEPPGYLEGGGVTLVGDDMRALELDPGHAHARYEMARILAAQSGDWAAAVAELQAALAWEPADAATRAALAAALAQSKTTVLLP